MGKILATSIMLPVIGLAGAAGYLTHQNIQTYKTELSDTLAQTNAQLAPQGLRLELDSVSEQYLGAMRDENYVLITTADGGRLIGFHQTVVIEPTRVHGTIGIDPEVGMAAVLLANAPGLVDGQSGYWQIGASRVVESHYQTGAFEVALPEGKKLTVSPFVVDSVSKLTGARESRATGRLQQLSLQDYTGSGFTLRDFTFNGKTHNIDSQPFIDRLDYGVGSFALSTADGSELTLKGVSTSQASVLDGDTFAVVLTGSLEDLKLTETSSDLSVDPSGFSVYVDGIHWPTLNAMGDALQSNDLETDPDAAVALLSGYGAELGSYGAKVTLEGFSSSFVFNDRGPEGIGAAGDVKATGFYHLEPGDADTLMEQWAIRSEAGLSINLSRSLLQSPFSEYMLAFIDAGFIIDDGERLFSEIRFLGGSVTANGLPLDGLLAQDAMPE